MSQPTSQVTAIGTLLDEPRTPYNRSELSECGIGYLREYAAHRGWGRSDLAAFLNGCLALAKEGGCSSDGDGLDRFTRSRFANRGLPPSHRAAKVAAFAQLVGRGLV